MRRVMSDKGWAYFFMGLAILAIGGRNEPQKLPTTTSKVRDNTTEDSGKHSSA